VYLKNWLGKKCCNQTIGISIFILSLGGYTIDAATQNQFMNVLLPYQGDHTDGGKYWGGHGVEVTWTPWINTNNNPIEVEVRHLLVTIIDDSDIARGIPESKKLLSLKKLHTLEKGRIRGEFGTFERGSASNCGSAISRAMRCIYLDAESHLLQSQPIPVYVYGLKKSELSLNPDLYDQYLVGIAYVSVNYGGKVKAWWESEQHRAQSRISAEVYKRNVESVIWAVLILGGLVLLWLLRKRILNNALGLLSLIFWVVRWLQNLALRLRSHIPGLRKKSEEVQKLEAKVHKALADGDYDEAAKYAALLEQLNKLRL
jgi:hypothetical protein